MIWIFIAGGAGSVARYLIGQWAVARYGVSFPIGTLVVNLVGCFALGALTHLASTWSFNPELRAAITIGFIGGFTTYSSFNHETIALLTAGSATTAAVYVTVTLAGGLAAGWLGLVVSRQRMA
ncbi:MAG TPA: fluoride efflux transporter CrcB [Vicinamibacterales bacterium]|nr:fluoride efflux transporter CrcB [Vicinamibacterales bacterium]